MPVVASRTEIAPGEMKGIDLQGTPVGVANVAGQYHAFSDACPHGPCKLSGGTLDGTVLTCPCHGCKFDLASGGVLGGPATTRIRTFRVQVEGDEIRI
jgi:nitrite reductase/ring-hydroxylating ferredoxin subunit